MVILDDIQVYTMNITVNNEYKIIQSIKQTTNQKGSLLHLNPFINDFNEFLERIVDC